MKEQTRRIKDRSEEMRKNEEEKAFKDRGSAGKKRKPCK
jgi:hypothetical protein